MMKKTLLTCLVLSSAAGAMTAAAAGSWEKIRHSDAPLAVISVSTGSYEVSYTVGEGCASGGVLEEAPVSAWSGYLSLVPADVVKPGLSGIASTASVNTDGALWGMTPGEHLDILFNEDVSAEVSDPALSVTQLYDNSGAVSNSTWPVTVSYNGNKMVVIPAASWPKGSVFAVNFSSGVADVNGSPLSDAATVYFSVIMDYQAANTAASLGDRRVRVTIPANAYSQDFFVTLSTGAGGQALADANAKLPSLPGSPEFVSTVRVNPYDVNGATLQPNSACVITLPYPDADGDGLLDGVSSKLKASSLAVWHLDETRGLWERQGGASLDAANRTVSQTVSHFSNYALLAVPDTDVSSVYAYPVPFRPSAGDTARYGSWAAGITFAGIPSPGSIRIYTVSGELVRKLAAAPPSVNWDVKNSDGQVVASGVYLWEVVAGRNRKTGKLVVIK